MGCVNKSIPLQNVDANQSQFASLTPQIQKFFQLNAKLDLFDRVLEFNTSQISNSKNKADLENMIRNTITTIYTNISTKVFENYSQKHMEYSKIRLIFCSNVLYNLLSLLDTLKYQQSIYWQQNCLEIYSIVNNESLKILGKLLQKYPVIGNTSAKSNIGNTIKSFDNTNDLKYNIFQNAKLQFFTFYNSNDNQGHTRQQLSKMYRQLYNLLIDESRNQFSYYKATMTQIFGQKVKPLIGCKFSDKVVKYSQTEMQQQFFKFKSPEMLRVFIKWIESLDQNFQEQNLRAQIKKFKVKKVLDHFFQNNRIEIKEVLLNQQQIEQLVETINQTRQFTKQESNKIQEGRFQLYTHFLEVIHNPLEFTPFKKDTVQTCEFVHSVANSLSNYALYFYKLFWTNMKVQIDNGGVDQILKHINLRSFKLGDLLRSKCEGPQEQIVQIYNRLVNHKQVELIRVKNRLNKGTRDMLINYKLKNSFLWCQVQLACTSQGTSDLGYYESKFNHFLYELKRSKFGPLTESVMILFFEDQRFRLWEQFRKTVKFQQITIPVELPSYIPNDGMSRQSSEIMTCPKNHQMSYFFEFPFYCNYCYKQLNINLKAQENFMCYLCSKCLLNICFKCCKKIPGFKEAVQQS